MCVCSCMHSCIRSFMHHSCVWAGIPMLYYSYPIIDLILIIILILYDVNYCTPLGTLLCSTMYTITIPGRHTH